MNEPSSVDNKMNTPYFAFLLSFVLPGAGLAYLGMWKWGAFNFLVVFLVGLTATLLLSEEILEQYDSYIAVGCAAGSAAVAQQLATMLNKQRRDRRAQGTRGPTIG